MKENQHKKVTVTAPLLPPLDEFTHYLEDIWKRGWITNNGHYHQQLEEQLKEYLNVPYISLFTNGTLPLMAALQTLRITGEVITTPYSFVATTHSLWWNNIAPVFVDVDPITGNLDPEKIEAAITPKTTAIMAVHVYGNPCDMERIQEIADTYGLKIIYDGAHAFGVERNGHSILNGGDLTTLSFHATKVFNTVEGGALICHDEHTKQRVDYLKNFGFANETTVVAPGINGKMDELRAAYGLLELKYIDAAIARRQSIAEMYRAQLKELEGIRFFEDLPDIQYNYSYFPIFVDAEWRDALYFYLQEQNIFGRRYFYPLISEFPTYRGLPSAAKENLPHAHALADSVVCLPISHLLTQSDVERICSRIKEFVKREREI